MFPLILVAALFGTPVAHAAPTQLMPPGMALQPPAGGGQAPPPPIEAAPLPPPTVAAPQPAPPPAEARPPVVQPQAAAPPQPAAPPAAAPPASAQSPAATPPAQPPAAALPPAAPQWPNSWTPEKTAELQVLDKIEGIAKTLTVAVGQSVTYGSLTIAVQACVVRPPDQPPDSAAFMTITDSRKDEPGFRGWSLQNEPWVSMLQNPVYDVQVVGCQP